MPEASEKLVELEQEEAVEVSLDKESTAEEYIEETEYSDVDGEISEEELASYSTGVRKRIDKLTAICEGCDR